MHEELLFDSQLLGSCGIPAPGVSVLVDAPDGEVGEVYVKGPNVMVGYWRNPEAAAEALVYGWYRTGDLGRFGGDHHLYIVDRVKDLIITGGENVYCSEVKEVLARHPAVAEVAVFGVPDERWGEAVHAAVMVRTGHANDGLADALRAHARASIAGYKVPKVIDLTDEPLPKSGPGKILKRALRDAWSALPQPKP